MSIEARYVHMLVCDDIRAELGNKFSFMGVYDTSMVVPIFPMTIPKIGIVVTVSTPVSRMFKDMHLELRLGDQVIASEDVSEKDLPVMQDTHDKDGNPYRFFARKSIFIVTPLTVEGPRILRAHVLSEGEELLSNGMSITSPAQVKPA